MKKYADVSKIKEQIAKSTLWKVQQLVYISIYTSCFTYKGFIR